MQGAEQLLRVVSDLGRGGVGEPVGEEGEEAGVDIAVGGDNGEVPPGIGVGSEAEAGEDGSFGGVFDDGEEAGGSSGVDGAGRAGGLGVASGFGGLEGFEQAAGGFLVDDGLNGGPVGGIPGEEAELAVAGGAAHGGFIGVEREGKALFEAAELELREQLSGSLEIGLPDAGFVEVELKGEVGDDGGELAAEAGERLIFGGFKGFASAAGEGVDAGEDGVEVAIFVEEGEGGLFADAGDAGDVVGGVALEGL